MSSGVVDGWKGGRCWGEDGVVVRGPVGVWVWLVSSLLGLFCVGGGCCFVLFFFFFFFGFCFFCFLLLL